MDRAAEKIVEAVHKVCPYSNPTAPTSTWP
jgi:organic hydroperoxide reductase OsmC/OhrA